MAYFDSPKNRAFWEKELEGLRKQRAAYQNGETQQEIQTKAPEMRNGYLCEEITFEQLNEEVFGKKTEVLYKPPQKTLQRELQHEM